MLQEDAGNRFSGEREIVAVAFSLREMFVTFQEVPTGDAAVKKWQDVGC